MCTIELRQLRKEFAGIQIIKGIDLTIQDREFIVFVGPSGCGKSTLLRMMAGLEDISSGEMLIDGKLINKITPDRRGLAMVFQSYALYPHMTVSDNMGLALRLAGVAKDERQRRVLQAARTLQLETLLDRKPANLSGGQRQRVAIGRAIVREPKAFLFDEPLSNLDAALRVQTRLEIAKLHRDINATMVYVTHDQVEAMTLAERIVVFNGGRIEQVGTPLDLYHSPANLFVAGFIGSPKMNLVGAVVTGTNGTGAMAMLDGGVSLTIPGAGLNPGMHITVGIRPEHIALAQGGPISGRVELVEHLGSEVIGYISIGAASPLTVKFPTDAAVKPGETIRLIVQANAISVFNDKGQAMTRPAGNVTSFKLAK